MDRARKTLKGLLGEIRLIPEGEAEFELEGGRLLQPREDAVMPGPVESLAADKLLVAPAPAVEILDSHLCKDRGILVHDRFGE